MSLESAKLSSLADKINAQAEIKVEEPVEKEEEEVVTKSDE